MRHDVVSIFAGIGGFDRGLEAAGFRVILQVEPDRCCRQLLEREWPGIEKLHDVRKIDTIASKAPAPFLLCGGDPCQSRSLAKGARASRHPDLSGYFLSLAGRLGPRWVVRENVPAPDVGHFLAGLEVLGYGVVVVELNAKNFTAQHRRRQFVVGCPPALRSRFILAVHDAARHPGDDPPPGEEETPCAQCLTAHPNRTSESDSRIFVPGRGLRGFVAEEYESLQGFPRGFTAGISRTARARLIGNAVPPPMTEWIGKKILEAEVLGLEMEP